MPLLPGSTRALKLIAGEELALADEEDAVAVACVVAGANPTCF